MKDFRDELLEDLLAHSGEFIDIKYLTDKYCGEDTTFAPDDQSLIKCRLNINLVLRELVEMKWILLQPQWGLSASHKLNHDTNRRYFTHEQLVKARLTTLGEVEYKKSKQLSNPQTYHDNSIHIGRDLTGVANTGNVGRDLANNAEDTESKSINKKGLTVNKLALIVAAIGIIVTIIIYLLQQGQKG